MSCRSNYFVHVLVILAFLREYSLIMAQATESKLDDMVQNNCQYSIHGYLNHQSCKYFSYETKSGWCRQIYDKATESQFQFIECDAKNNKWYIKNKFNDKRIDQWLSCGKCDTRTGESIGLYTNIKDRAIWELIPQNETMQFKIKCHLNNKFKGWLSFQSDGKWNKLKDQESDACIYKLQKIKLNSFKNLYQVYHHKSDHFEKFVSFDELEANKHFDSIHKNWSKIISLNGKLKRKGGAVNEWQNKCETEAQEDYFTTYKKICEQLQNKNVLININAGSSSIKINNLEKENTNLNNQLSLTKSEIDKLTDTINNLKSQNNILNESKTKLENKINELNQHKSQSIIIEKEIRLKADESNKIIKEKDTEINELQDEASKSQLVCFCIVI